MRREKKRKEKQTKKILVLVSRSIESILWTIYFGSMLLGDDQLKKNRKIGLINELVATLALFGQWWLLLVTTRALLDKKLGTQLSLNLRYIGNDLS